VHGEDGLIESSAQEHSSKREYRKFETYENQRVWMGIFKDVLFPHERAAWSDKDGKVKLPKNSILLPIDGDWKWETGWEIQKDANFNDKNGWCYANDFNSPFKKTRGLLDFVRRRKWVRVASRLSAGSQDVAQASTTATVVP